MPQKSVAKKVFTVTSASDACIPGLLLYQRWLGAKWGLGIKWFAGNSEEDDGADESTVAAVAHGVFLTSAGAVAPCCS